jgi:pSer/pThr/pTyr-binding forkhead associated (FHA) protein
MSYGFWECKETCLISDNDREKIGGILSLNYDRPMSSESQKIHRLIIEDDQGRRELTIDGLVYSIGRDPRCDIRLVSQFVSRRHATLLQLPNDDGTHYYRIVDGRLKGAPSANGLLINGRKTPQHDLQNKDEIIFAPHVRATYYLLNNSPEDALDAPLDEFDTTLIPPPDKS